MNAGKTLQQIIKHMKNLVIIFFSLFITTVAFSQKDADVIRQKAEALHRAVFVNKDSLSLEALFAKEVTYGHSGGKVQSRKEAIDDISHNKSTYADPVISDITVTVDGTTAVSRQLFTATENTKDGKSVPLKLHIVLVWAKEKKEWRLVARQAVKVG